MKFNDKRFIILLVSFLLFLGSKCSKTIDLKIEQLTHSYIGKNSILLLKLDKNGKNIKELFKKEDTKTYFKTSIYSKKEELYEINCGFLTGFIYSEKYIFCNIGENINAGEYSIKINQNFNYLDYQININQDNTASFIIFDYNIPFLYSGKQLIEVKDDINLYKLKFKIYSYNNQPLILTTTGNYLTLENCEINNDELICYLEKDAILSIMDNTQVWLKLEYIANKVYQTEFQFVDYIIIKYNSNKKKENVKVNIKKLLTNCTENYRFIAYETDITNLPIISTDFYSGFYLEFENSSGCEYFKSRCRFVKYNIGPLLILCKIEGGKGEYRLKMIENEIDVEFLNINYNFVIQPVNNTETFYLSDVKFESFGIMNYYKILDFRKNDSYEIIYYMKNPNGIKNIRLNDDSNDDLLCKDNNKIKTCIISKNHFQGKENGFYYTSYKNQCGYRSILYEFAPVKIILN